MVAQGLNIPDRCLGAWPPEHAGTPPSAGNGTLLVLVCGLHGNEPAGVHAARRVLRDLEQMDLPFHGKLVALAGNMRALELGERYLERDLNRAWTEESIAELHELAAEDSEARELLELKATIEAHLDGGGRSGRGCRRVVLLDLHSTSADGSPFVIMGDTLQNRSVGAALRVPILLGLEERLDGTLLSYFSKRGHTALCIEGGQSDLDSTVDNHEAAIWLTLASTGIVPRERIEDLGLHEERLAETSWGLPDFIEVRHREDVVDAESFRMEPGYTNFHLIKRGETLGWVEQNGSTKAIRTPLDGFLLMPRYQGQGDDAFFVGTGLSARWLRLSAVLRQLRLHWLLPCLPAVTRKHQSARALLLDGRRDPAPWVIGLLHLFGYRKRARVEHSLLFIRRRDARF